MSLFYDDNHSYFDIENLAACRARGNVAMLVNPALPDGRPGWRRRAHDGFLAFYQGFREGDRPPPTPCKPSPRTPLRQVWPEQDSGSVARLREEYSQPTRQRDRGRL